MLLLSFEVTFVSFNKELLEVVPLLIKLSFDGLPFVAFCRELFELKFVKSDSLFGAEPEFVRFSAFPLEFVALAVFASIDI